MMDSQCLPNAPETAGIPMSCNEPTLHDLNPSHQESTLDLQGSAQVSNIEQSITFQLGWRRVTARGIVCDHHPNVAFLSIPLSRVVSLFNTLECLLPKSWIGCFRAYHPEFLLPSNVMLERQKRDWADEFDNEKMIYHTLAPVQGTVVPRLYGEAKCLDTEGAPSRALILSNMSGTQLNLVQGLTRPCLEDMLKKCLGAMTHLGVAHGDPRLDNFLLVKDRIVAVDFDIAFLLEGEAPDQNAEFDMKHLSRYYYHPDRVIEL